MHSTTPPTMVDGNPQAETALNAASVTKVAVTMLPENMRPWMAVRAALAEVMLANLTYAYECEKQGGWVNDGILPHGIQSSHTQSIPCRSPLFRRGWRPSVRAVGGPSPGGPIPGSGAHTPQTSPQSPKEGCCCEGDKKEVGKKDCAINLKHGLRFNVD